MRHTLRCVYAMHAAQKCAKSMLAPPRAAEMGTMSLDRDANNQFDGPLSTLRCP